MTKFEAFRQAIEEIGDVDADELSAYIQSKFGILITAAYIPVFRATLRAKKNATGVEKGQPSLTVPSHP